MRHDNQNPEAGFSLAELMVAMVITLIVTGAIFGLLSSGQSAFKVQPERTERQQNIRTAMDLITRDTASAGVGMPSFVQTFKSALDGVGTTTGPTGVNTDEIEILANTGGFPNEEGCTGGGTSDNFAALVRATSSLTAGGEVMVFFQDGSWTVRKVTGISSTGSPYGCSASGRVELDMASGGINPSGVCQPTNSMPALGYALGNAGSLPPVAACGSATPCCRVASVGFGSVVHYRIRPDATERDDANILIPNLERSVNGAAFQVVARGVEDLQVQYMKEGDVAAGIVTDNAPAVDPLGADFNSLIVQVRVTLVTRASSRKILGATTAASGAALRGSLSSQVSPRQALATLTTEGIASPKWN